MKVITGAAGFLGSNLAAALENEDSEIVICDWLDSPAKLKNLAKRSSTQIIQPENLFEFFKVYGDKIDVVFLLGAISSTTETNLSLITNVNVDLPKQIWNWCRDNFCRLIYASSAATYGNGSSGFRDNFSVRELRELKPLNVYGRSKNQFDIWVAQQIETGKATPSQWVGLKFFNVYGPNEYHKGKQMSVVPQFYRQIIETNRARLFQSHNPEYSDGGQLRDFVWVGDCVKVMQWFDRQPKVSGLFNCGTGKARTYWELASSIFSVLGKQIDVDFIPIPENIRENYQYFTEANIRKLRKAGYSDEFTVLEVGVETYVREYLMSDDKYL